MHKETTFNYKSILAEIKFIGFTGIVVSIAFVCLLYFTILYYKLHVYSTASGILFGSILGVVLVHLSTYKAHPKIGKIKTEMNRIYRSYRHTKAALTVIALHVLLMEITVFYYSKYTATFMVSEFSGYVVYTTIASFFLYAGIGYVTAWYNYKEHHQNPK